MNIPAGSQGCLMGKSLGQCAQTHVFCVPISSHGLFYHGSEGLSSLRVLQLSSSQAQTSCSGCCSSGLPKMVLGKGPLEASSTTQNRGAARTTAAPCAPHLSATMVILLLLLAHPTRLFADGGQGLVTGAVIPPPFLQDGEKSGNEPI